MSLGVINAGKSLPDVAVLRGGDRDFRRSLQEGGDVLASMSTLGHSPLDVLVGKDGGWMVGGRPVDPHYVYTRAHTIVDTTRMSQKPYHVLAKKMGIPLLLSQEHSALYSREDVYRILRQKEILVPDTVVVRSDVTLNHSLFRTIWTTFHTPLMIRPLVKSDNVRSILVTQFKDLIEKLTEFHSQGVDVHVLTYKRTPTSSVAVLPHFRNEEVYVPIWVETFSGLKDIPNETAKIRAYTHIPQFRKDQMKEIATVVYKTLGATAPLLIDVVSVNNEYMVVNVDFSPSLRPEGRFIQSLKTTGVDIGQYLHSHIKNELSR